MPSLYARSPLAGYPTPAPGSLAATLAVLLLAVAASAEPAPAPAAELQPAFATAAASIPEGDAWDRIPTSLEYDPFFEDEFEFDVPEIYDPFEPTNRVVLMFNRGVDTVVLDPLTRGYRFVVPEPARDAIRRVFQNLNSPSILVNQVLQLRFRDAGETFGRFVLNSSIGWGGLFDVALEAGWERQEADFGQTLALVGVGPGPYLVLPILGPNTVRDGVGDIVDRAMQPLTYLIGPTPSLVIGTGSGFTTRAAKAEALNALKESSVDYYAALRSAYLQNRAAQIWGSDGAGALDEQELAAPSHMEAGWAPPAD